MSQLTKNLINMVKQSYKPCTFSIKCYNKESIYNNGLFKFHITNKSTLTCNTNYCIPYVAVKHKYNKDITHEMILNDIDKDHDIFTFYNDGVIPVEWVNMFLRFNEYQDESSLVIHDNDVSWIEEFEDNIYKESPENMLLLLYYLINNYITIPKYIKIYDDKMQLANRNISENKLKLLGINLNNFNTNDIIKKIQNNSPCNSLFEFSHPAESTTDTIVYKDNEYDLKNVDLQTIVILNEILNYSHIKTDLLINYKNIEPQRMKYERSLEDETFYL